MAQSNVRTAAERRRARVLALRQAGKTFREIADVLAVSPARAAQIHRDAERWRTRAVPLPPPPITRGLALEALPVSYRARQVLGQTSYQTVEDLLRLDRPELMVALLRLPNCGRAECDEINAVLNEIEPAPSPWIRSKERATDPNM